MFNVRPQSLITIEESTQNPLSRQQRTALAINSGEANFLTPARNSTTTISTPTVRTTPDRETTGSIQVAESGATGLRIFSGRGEAQTKGGQKIALASNQAVNVDAGGAAGATVNLPTRPSLTAPPNQTEVAYPDLAQGVTLLVWNPVQGAAGYRVMVDFSPGFERPLYDRQGVRNTQMELRALEAGSYFWKVAAIDSTGAEGDFSDLWRFSLTKAPQSTAAPPPLVIELAELKTEVESLRALTYQACEHYVAGEDVTEWATMAKLKAGRLNRQVPDTCLQFWGGMGFTWDNKVSRMYRDGRLASIGGGADEVMLGILTKMMGIAKRPVH